MVTAVYGLSKRPFQIGSLKGQEFCRKRSEEMTKKKKKSERGHMKFYKKKRKIFFLMISLNAVIL